MRKARCTRAPQIGNKIRVWRRSTSSPGMVHIRTSQRRIRLNSWKFCLSANFKLIPFAAYINNFNLRINFQFFSEL